MTKDRNDELELCAGMRRQINRSRWRKLVGVINVINYMIRQWTAPSRSDSTG